MRFKAVVVIIVVVSCIAISSSYSAVGGLKTKFGFVVVENLQPGQSYNIRQIVGFPLSVINAGVNRVELQIDVQVPEVDQEPGMVKAGYEPIPDTSWIKLTEDFFEVEPGQSAVTDVIIEIPDDDKYLGKKCQVNLWSHTCGKNFLNVGLRSKLRFTIADKRATPEDLKNWEESREKLKDINFNLLPHKVFIEDLKVGKKVNLEKKHGVTFKLVNPSDETFKYTLKSISVKKSSMGLFKGYEDTPDPEFLILDETEFEVEPVTIKKIKAYIKFPKDKQYRGKKYMFIVCATVMGQPVEFNIYSRILVDTEE